MGAHSTQFRRIALEGWRQFDHIEIELHQRLTIITGANGAGKSSILRVFSRHFGFDRPFLSTPVLVGDKFTYSVGLFSSWINRFSSFFKKAPGGPVVGKLSYANGHETELSVHDTSSVQYTLNIHSQAAVEGVHIDSHQPVANYRPIGSIPSTLMTSESVYSQYNSEVQQWYQGHAHSGYTPLYRMKEAIVAMAVFGESNSRSVGNPALLSALNGFVEVLRKVLPPSLGFLDLSVRPPEIVLQTRTGEFLFDAASGGVATLIDMAWRLHMFSIDKEEFVVTMDEPENHLHPSMQRSLMRRLLDAFPKAQFIVATHSPFIVTSVRDSSVYVLRYNSGEREIEGFIPETTTSRVLSERLDTINKSSSANEILREVLGVEATVPEWVTEDLGSIVARYSGAPLSGDVLKRLRAELESLGYENQYPVALAELVAKHD